VPQPAQEKVPVWLAADDLASVQRAAAEGWGLVSAATHTHARVARMVDAYMKASNGRAPELTLARFASTAATHEEASGVAKAYFESFTHHAIAAGWGNDAQQSMARQPDALMADSLVGTMAMRVAPKRPAMALNCAATSTWLPTSGQFDTHKHILADFVDEIRPMLDED